MWERASVSVALMIHATDKMCQGMRMRKGKKEHYN